MLAESEVDEELVCETSVSGFKPRRSTQLEGAAEWSATGLENQGVVELQGFDSSTFLQPPEAEKRGAVLITQRQQGQYLPGGLFIFYRRSKWYILDSKVAPMM